jgi:hypothetical protein
MSLLIGILFAHRAPSGSACFGLPNPLALIENPWDQQNRQDPSESMLPS